MSNKKHNLSILEIVEMFPDNETAEQWFIDNRWGDKITCPLCKSNNITSRKTIKRSWRCNDCRKDFSTKTGTIMQGSNLDFKTWVWAIYLLTSNIKGISSIKMSADLKITQKSAWHLCMRIRETYKDNKHKLFGIVEMDETFIGGKEKTSMNIKD